MAPITTVRARGVTVPLDVATSLSSRRVVERHYGLVEVRTADGIAGIGFCYVGSAGAGLFPLAVAQLLAPRLIGQDSHRVEGLWQEMYQEVLLQGRAGTVMRALSALDTAIWDRNARAAGLPLHKYLGAVTTRSVPAYASGGYFVEGKTPSDLADEMEGFVRSGFRAVKMKVGKGRDIKEEEERVAAVRERIGGDVVLMLDANNAWADVPAALRFVRMFERYDPYFIEEPFGPDDIDNHARLARATPILVATGEIEAGRWRFKQILDQGAAAILQTDACVCGGISEFRRIAATAASAGVTLSPHWFHDLHHHLVASIPNGRWVEYFPDDQVLNFRRLIDRQVTVEGGEILLDDAPGLGFGFLDAAVDRYAATPWVEVGAQPAGRGATIHPIAEAAHV